MTKPFIKWAGGKRWLSAGHPQIFQVEFDRLVEPFAGSASTFFSLTPKAAWLNDVNEELINVYECVRDDWRALVYLLKDYQKKHSNAFYYKMRDSEPGVPLIRAARFLYLNRTCFNGLYRVNLRGQFNVPVGSKNAVIMPDDDFESVSILLKEVKLTSLDFEDVVDLCGEGDLVYLDPPYTVKHNLNGFVKYNEKLFSWADQVRLRDAAIRAKSRGAIVLVSNADHESIWELYAGSSEIRSVERSSVMAADSLLRRKTTEVVIWP